MEGTAIKCENCGHVINEGTGGIMANPCPRCGGKDIVVEFSDDVPHEHDSIEGKMKSATGGKPIYEFFDGDELQKSTGKWMAKTRVVDRQKDNYQEIVIDPETGKIIHRCDEPLSQHRGHGSDKHKK
jgi:predicted  nucleic acid-binding Zn-ribbon protein